MGSASACLRYAMFRLRGRYRDTRGLARFRPDATRMTHFLRWSSSSRRAIGAVVTGDNVALQSACHAADLGTGLLSRQTVLPHLGVASAQSNRLGSIGQCERKGGSVAQLRLRPNPPTVAFHNRFANRKPDT
jgi:hypothetical protein